ncbi:hypothetical protein E2C01_084881 [Portunus trituberculatus]|uniref:Uncharacterized protein n=1 Tax=Portunus trituberculatus TaxID=210409 RepID=A0A5B7J5B3_PORTR|nr:hypothetical protein [Portunus trituberculatus]
MNFKTTTRSFIPFPAHQPAYPEETNTTCPALPCPALPCPALPCPVLSCLAVLSPATHKAPARVLFIMSTSEAPVVPKSSVSESIRGNKRRWYAWVRVWQVRAGAGAGEAAGDEWTDSRDNDLRR